MDVVTRPSVSNGRAPVARADAAFPWCIALALAAAVAGGFVLAVLLPLAAALEWAWGVRWRALVQAHGHLQVGGWVGLFIVGMAFRLVPRFAGRPLRFPRVTLPVLVLLPAGLLGRAVAQPWLDVPGMRVLLTLSALAELAGARLFATAIVATLAPAVRTFAPAPLLVLGAGGLLAQAALGAVWLMQLPGDAPAIPADRNAALLSLQFYAFQLPFVLGVSLRALPSIFAHPAPAPHWTRALAAALAAGAALHAGTPLLMDGAAGVRPQQFGALLVAAAISGGVALTAPGRQRLRGREALAVEAEAQQGVVEHHRVLFVERRVRRLVLRLDDERPQQPLAHLLHGVVVWSTNRDLQCAGRIVTGRVRRQTDRRCRNFPQAPLTPE